MSESKNDSLEEIKKILKDDIFSQIDKRKNNDIVLFKLPREIKCSGGIVPMKWQYKVYIIFEVLLTYKLSANLYCFEEGIKDDYHPEPYYWYSYISPMYRFSSDRAGIYRSDLFGLVFPTSKLFGWPSDKDIKSAEIDKYLT